MLDRLHPPRREALAVADAVDVVDDRHLGVAAEQKVAVQRMGWPALDGTQGGDQRLPDHLSTEHALPPGLWRATAKQVHFERLEIKDGKEVFDRGHEVPGHRVA